MWYEQINFINANKIEDVFGNLDKPNSMIIAGGTDILVRLKNHKNNIKHFININNIPELKQIEYSDNKIKIGSCVTFSELLNKTWKIFPPLFEAAKTLAGPQVRNTATIGGNIINASPAGDSLPVLYAFDAELKFQAKTYSRIIKIKDFIIGPGKTLLKNGELLTQIIINIPKYDYLYKKFGTRKSLALSKVSFCGVKLRKTGNIVMAFGASGPTIIVVKTNITDDIDKILKIVDKTVSPISDQRSDADYRKYLCVEVARDFLENL